MPARIRTFEPFPVVVVRPPVPPIFPSTSCVMLAVLALALIVAMAPLSKVMARVPEKTCEVEEERISEPVPAKVIPAAPVPRLMSEAMLKAPLLITVPPLNVFTVLDNVTVLGPLITKVSAPPLSLTGALMVIPWLLPVLT